MLSIINFLKYPQVGNFAGANSHPGITYGLNSYHEHDGADINTRDFKFTVLMLTSTR